jgi:hypothetical protein
LGEAMRIARFYQKTLFGVFAMIGLIVALTSALYVYTVDRQLTGDFLKNSRAIARSIADSNVDLIVHRNYSALQSIIDQFVEISSISYVFVVDEKGVIIAHTFVPGVPGEILADYTAHSRVSEISLRSRQASSPARPATCMSAWTRTISLCRSRRPLARRSIFSASSWSSACWRPTG